MTPEALTFCREDTREQIVGALAEAVARGLEPPDEATRLRRQVQAIHQLAAGNDSQRKIALEYTKQLNQPNG